MNTGLLLIDVQHSFTQSAYFSRRDLPRYLESQNALLAGAIERRIPVVRIFHVQNDSSHFSLESGHVRPLDGLMDVTPAATFHKSRHSALVGSGLDVWLTQNNIQRVIVSGIRTEQCCETTTRHLSDLGYTVDFVPEATLTFDMKHADGSVFPANEIKQRTISVLNQRFARIASVEQALEGSTAH